MSDVAESGSPAATDDELSSGSTRASESAQPTASVLRHPLVVGAALALFSGLLASLLIPAFTRTWQDRPKELALKRDLVQRISESATDTIVRARYFGDDVEQGRMSGDRRMSWYLPVVRKWRIDSAIIGSELITYFPDTELHRRWQDYFAAVGAFVHGEAHPYPGRIRPGASALDRSALRDHFQDVRFDTATSEQRRQRFLEEPLDPRIASDDAFFLLSDERDQIERMIVSSKASGFSHGFWIFDY
jgi:hypothetical protein